MSENWVLPNPVLPMFSLKTKRNLLKKKKKISQRFGHTGVGNTQFLDNFFYLFFYKNFTCEYFWTKNNKNDVEKFL